MLTTLSVNYFSIYLRMLDDKKLVCKLKKKVCNS